MTQSLRTASVFACLAAGLMAAGLDYSPAGPTAAQIDDYLTRKHSPMAGMGSVFSTYGHDYNVDPRLVVAIAGAETTFGQHQCTANNAWNWFHRQTCQASAFATYQDGAEHVTRFLRRSYLNRGYDTIELIRYKYCASGCDHWIPLVTAFHGEMPLNAAPAPRRSPAPPPRRLPARPLPARPHRRPATTTGFSEFPSTSCSSVEPCWWGFGRYRPCAANVIGNSPPASDRSRGGPPSAT